jgi:transcriptional regulator with XRE-family HTH domain
MTQGELAKALGCSRALVEAWMSGRRRPSYEKAAAIHAIAGDAVPVGSWAYPERIRTDGIDV